jgi:NAD-dependent dihydropyrimidine dehydrogenase PreA subunit
MKLYLLHSSKVLDFFSHIAKDGSVFYPVLEDGKTHMVRFDKDKGLEPNFEKIRTAENVKHFFLPSRDVVATYPDDTDKKVAKQYIVGVKNCDIRGIDIYDRVFMQWEPIDPLYQKRRENTTIISADCPQPEDCCFCNLVGLQPYAETVSDINITPLSAGLLFEVLTERGEEVVSAAKDLFTEVDKEQQKERDSVRKAAVKKLSSINEKSFKDDLDNRTSNASAETKHDARNDCVECHACLHACPTCYCFLLSDHKRGKDVERVRTWDACYYAAYARVGGGANPRSTLDDRFWNRFECKFNFFKQYEDFYACSGCGRCYRGCSAKIDIREILWKL